MRPLDALDAAAVRGLRGVVFDLDGTLLTGGALTLEAYRALFRLRGARQAELTRIAAKVQAAFPGVPLADDNDLRVTDRTFDMGETARQPRATIVAMKALAVELGARTFESSIHLHVTLERDDKASG